MRDLLNVLAVVLAALQLIPAFVFPTTQVPFLVITVIIFGAFVFIFLRFIPEEGAAPALKKTIYRKYVPVLLLVFLAVTGVGYKMFKLRQEITQLEQKLDTYTGAGPIREYLDAVVTERSAGWNHQFEKKYARPTLYLLNESGTRDHSPDEIQTQLLQWRTGTDGMSPELWGVALLMGESIPATNDVQKVAKGIINFVDRPLADSDLLNKRSGDSEQKGVSDDVPKYVLVLGDPAVGKSSMLERLDLIQARRARGSKDEPIPVLVNLKGLSHVTQEVILSKIRERLGKAADLVQATRSITLMVDSLDETDFPRETAAAIAEVSTNALWDRVIVASRLLNYSVQVHNDESALWRHKFVTAILYGLDQTAIEKQILGATAEVRRNMFQKLARTETRSAWLQFLRLPLDFELVQAVMEDSDGEVPRGQCEIMRRFFEKRFEHKGFGADTADAREILSRAAMFLLKSGAGARSRDFSAEDCISSGISASSERAENQRASARLKQAADAGILVERKGRYKFFHLNVQDYFAATARANLDGIDPLDVQLRAYILFRAGMEDGERVVTLVEQNINKTTRPSERAYLTDLLKHVKNAQMVTK